MSEFFQGESQHETEAASLEQQLLSEVHNTINGLFEEAQVADAHYENYDRHDEAIPYVAFREINGVDYKTIKLALFRREKDPNPIVFELSLPIHEASTLNHAILEFIDKNSLCATSNPWSTEHPLTQRLFNIPMALNGDELPAPKFSNGDSWPSLPALIEINNLLRMTTISPATRHYFQNPNS